jgi:hypothetical protein
MFNKEMIENSKYKRYDWCSNKNSSRFDLFLTLDSGGYRVAYYSTRDQKLTLTIPEIHIPSETILLGFIEKCENCKKESDL